MLELDVIDRESELVVKLSGMIDTLAAHELDRHHDRFVSGRQQTVVSDLTDLSYLNSSGIKSLVMLDRKLRKSGKLLLIRGASAHVRRIFGYCGLDNYFHFEGLEAELPLL